MEDWECLGSEEERAAPGAAAIPFGTPSWVRRKQSHLICSTSACPALIRARCEKTGMDCHRQHSQELDQTHAGTYRGPSRKSRSQNPHLALLGSPNNPPGAGLPSASEHPKSFTLESGKTRKTGRSGKTPEELPPCGDTSAQAHSPGPGIARIFVPSQRGFFMEFQIC